MELELSYWVDSMRAGIIEEYMLLSYKKKLLVTNLDGKPKGTKEFHAELTHP